jgi:hypothetical protein
MKDNSSQSELNLLRSLQENDEQALALLKRRRGAGAILCGRCHVSIRSVVRHTTSFKKTDMKLSKSLLSAIVVGVAVQSAVSCTKTSVKPGGLNPGGPAIQAEQRKSPGAGRPYQPAPIPEWLINGCPACGMG